MYRYFCIFVYKIMIVNNPSTFLLRSMQLSNEKINSIKDVISTGDGIFDPVTFVFSGLIFSHSPHERRFEFIKITIQSASVIALTNSCECFENFSLPWVSSLRLRTGCLFGDGCWAFLQPQRHICRHYSGLKCMCFFWGIKKIHLQNLFLKMLK